MPSISPHSVLPSFHPTRDYWFTHNLLFNIREQTFQNLCNLSISMCLSSGFDCASAQRSCLFLVYMHCIQMLYVSYVCHKRETSPTTCWVSHLDKLENIAYLLLRTECTVGFQQEKKHSAAVKLCCNDGSLGILQTEKSFKHVHAFTHRNKFTFLP